MDETSELKKTPLHTLHLSLGARMVPFAGYDMPVQYPAGVLKEHLHTRSQAGLFDVSHMGQIVLRARSGDNADAARALETLVPVDVLGLGEGRQRYALFTNDRGGILDDLMIANRGDHFYIVVNAACKDADFAHMQAAIGDRCEIKMHDDRALVALQGPRAEAVLGEFWSDVTEMRFMDVRACDLHDADCIVSRSGYTGEDGFEISIPADQAHIVCSRLLDHPDVMPIGLGARDSLRLEAGLCLYGNEIDAQTTPVEAALEWAIQKVRRKGGERAGGFPGADVILGQLENGATRRRVGLRPEGRAPVRGGVVLSTDPAGENAVGTVTSGGFGPSVEGPVAMGYVTTDQAVIGTQLHADVRGKALPVTIAPLPFVKSTVKR
ncbi:glycine cleavage system aminomethyltransferase GcvT [Shinella daejeonensis]|uniref:glycine cleavage system aminomethyltransferase GcvT n=1 Tax=Shinella daejeonensis TaxID=659017 RepID=UPI0020C7C00A|nr:glycine cleavage system aminomethyltransferase GcvT [Shinella daejeonensis]MCP8893525.1 glycine cleavage system aminomethyltransferase GcvT [Shinella daejeonensis]